LWFFSLPHDKRRDFFSLSVCKSTTTKIARVGLKGTRRFLIISHEFSYHVIVLLDSSFSYEYLYIAFLSMKEYHDVFYYYG